MPKVRLTARSLHASESLKDETCVMLNVVGLKAEVGTPYMAPDKESNRRPRGSEGETS